MSGMIRIGDFAAMTGASVATLRLYDTQRLLTPSFVDPQSGYRYYQRHQLADFQRLSMLQSLGFTLREIRDVGEDEVAKLLAKKLAESQKRLQIERQKVHQIGLQIQLIEGILKMNETDVQVLDVPEMKVVAIHLEIASNDQVGEILGDAYGRLYGAVDRQQSGFAGPCLAVWSSTPDMVTDEIVDAALPVEGEFSEEDDLKLTTLPAAQVASLTHKGPFSEFQACHLVLKGWLAKNHYRLSGPYREIYHTPPSDEAITEVQYPIEPIRL